MKQLMNLFLKDCLHVKWTLIGWYGLLVWWTVHRVRTNGFSFSYPGYSGAARVDLVDAIFYPVFAVIAITTMFRINASEPLVSPTGYWRLRPISAATILRSKWIFIAIHFLVVPFLAFLATLLMLGMPFGMSTGGAGLKAGFLVVVALVTGAVAYQAQTWSRYAGFLLIAGIAGFLVRTFLGGLSRDLPLLSMVGILLGGGIGSLLAMIVYWRSEQWKVSVGVLFGAIIVIGGGSIGMGKSLLRDAEEIAVSPAHQNVSRGFSVEISRVEVENNPGSRSGIARPNKVVVALEVSEPKYEQGAYVHLDFTDAMIGERALESAQPSWYLLAQNKYRALAEIIGKPVKLPGDQEQHHSSTWATSFASAQLIPESGRFSCKLEARFIQWRLLGSIPIDGKSHTLDFGHSKLRLREETEPWPNGAFHFDFDAYHHLLRPGDRVDDARWLPVYRYPEYYFVYAHPDDDHCYPMDGEFRRTTAISPPDFTEVGHRLSVRFWRESRDSVLGGTLYILKEEKLGGITLPLSAEVPMGGE